MGGGKGNFNALRNLKKYKLKLCVFQKKKKVIQRGVETLNTPQTTF